MSDPSSPNTNYGRRGFLDALVLVIPAIPFALVFGLAVRESGIAIWLGWS
ncbi:MAG: hypothetical protein P8N99_09575 [Luminiphilus sp.]|nr:hypothetical protein [Luminiphilus sp.]